MITIDERLVRAPADLVFNVAADVERWPSLLPHYRWVRFLDKQSFGTGVVEMAAWRIFAGLVKYPTWWISQMRVAEHEPAIYYRHIDGVTSGMDVKWELNRQDGYTFVRLIHEWPGPAWPLIRGIAADWFIGPHFISAIAQRTLAGVARAAETRAGAPT